MKSQPGYQRQDSRGNQTYKAQVFESPVVHDDFSLNKRRGVCSRVFFDFRLQVSRTARGLFPDPFAKHTDQQIAGGGIERHGK